MNHDRKLIIAILILIGLVGWLIVISFNRGTQIQQIQNSLKNVQINAGIQGVHGVQGIQGLPGTNGVNGANGKDGSPGMSAYDTAVSNGFQGSQTDWLNSLKGDKGDAGTAAPEKSMTCLNGVLAFKYTSDFFWQYTNIKCELVNEQD